MTDLQRYQNLLMDKKLTLLQLAQELKNISKACEIVGYSRQQYYNIKERFYAEGEAGLQNRSRAPKRIPSKAPLPLEQKVLTFVLKYPCYSYERVSDNLKLEEGIFISPGKVRGIFNRYRLNRFKERLLYLEREHQKHGFELTPEQRQLLSRISERVEYQHVYAPCAGYLLAQDTFYVGYLKGVGKVYMQSVIDCSNSFAFAKLYTSKDGIPAAHILQDRVLPFYRKMGITIGNILTDNGTEYCGLDDHPYELLLSLFNIRHRTTKVKSPHTNGFVERFHKTILNEFFKIQFRIKYYSSVEMLQDDLDKYLIKYNFQRPHRGYRLNGLTPSQGLLMKPYALALPLYN